MKHIDRNCNHCNVKLVLGENYSEYRYKQKDYACKSCYLEITKEYNKVNNKIQNKLNMYVNGKYIPRSHPLHKPGNYKTFEDAAFSSLSRYASSTEGEVYIITNPAWDGWIKVGMAIEAEDRCKGYQTSSPMRDYQLEYKKYFDDRRKAEQIAHSLCSKKAKEKNGEWFKLDIPTAIACIEKIFIEKNNA